MQAGHGLCFPQDVKRAIVDQVETRLDGKNGEWDVFQGFTFSQRLDFFVKI